MGQAGALARPVWPLLFAELLSRLISAIEELRNSDLLKIFRTSCFRPRVRRSLREPVGHSAVARIHI